MTITAANQAAAAVDKYVAAQLKDDDASKPFHAAIQQAQETKEALATKRKQLTDLKQLTPLGVDKSMEAVEQEAEAEFAVLRATVQKEAEKLVAANTPAMPEVNPVYSARVAEQYNNGNGKRDLMLRAIGGDVKLAAALVHEAQQGFINVTAVMQQQLRNVVAPAPELDDTAAMRLQLAQIANNALSL